jgi:uncharacterized SAM-binding protein YcdF (DUF218 family)
MFKNRSIITNCLIIFFIVLVFSVLSSSFFGWFGYEKWKYRRSTFGNKAEAIERGVFVRELNYHSNINLKNFHVYIEKVFKYGYLTSSNTRLINEDKYPYQLTFNIEDTINNFNYDYVNHEDFDSIDLNLYLDKPYLEKLLILKVEKYNNNQWDSIGYIKVWDKKIIKNIIDND